MSDDRIEEGLHAYADQVRRTAGLPPAAAIRERAARRRRNRLATAAAAVLVAGIGIGIGAGLGPQRPDTPAHPVVSRSPQVIPSGTVSSNLTQLEELGVDLDTDVLIDVADDGVDRFLEVGANAVADFTGTAKGDSTRMRLRPAPTTGRNEVWLVAAAWNECVTDTEGAVLAVRPCVIGDESQVWRIVPAGDSGQFELAGRYGIVRIEEGLITSGPTGRTGLQTLRFDR